ncbi:oligosaccharide biosynthesis protein Alg14 like-domain-containing protein [Xylaria cubensis]|nr:oligosaccharide biosynthesis protein Alg14 like-domain-containing protein [Xylaria cubensis]
MNTNKDQAIQNAIGNFVADFIQQGIVLLVILGAALVVTAIVLKLSAGLHITGGAVLGVLAPLVVAVYLISGVDAGMVRGLSTHYVLLICGSGGHTAEMIQMVERSIRAEKSSHRRWAVGKDDQKSYDKVLAFEHRLFERFSRHSLDSGIFDIVRFERARYVHQSWLTTPFTAILSLVEIARILTAPPDGQHIHRSRYPGVIVTNGPGTGFLFLLVARALKLIRCVPTSHMRSIYVESWARVKSLSLTGKLIRRFKLADLFIVQYPVLAGPGDVLAENLLVMPQEPHVPINT